jgi:two-component system chemotaxis sensor kinase CheA
MAEDLSKYRDTFLSEGKEHLASMNNTLLKLEKDPSKVSWVNDIFREAHTLKSMAAAMNYDQTAKLCHAIEDVLDAIKKKKIRTDRYVDILFECFDCLESTLKNIKENKEELDVAKLVERLRLLASAGEVQVSEKEESKEESAIPKVESIGVKVERLNLLMNLAEELLINKMRLDKIKEDLRQPELSAAVDGLGRLVSEIQYNVMQSRLVPIEFVFNRFPRMVRDLAKQQKKEINLEIEGGDIELDRSVIDEIGESLVHLIRNAVDHGIEPPEARQRSGKPPSATIRLSAMRTKDFAIIKVFDDGAGLDIEDIRNTAIKRGILSPQAMKEEVIHSIFSGVSTTREVSAVSGRGFGLNIVKNKIESIGGEIRVESEPKKGTTFTIEIPLTLAIIKSLFVRVGDRIYAIPLASIERLVTVVRREIKGMVNYEAIVLSGEDILITRLNELFHTPHPPLEKQPIVIVWKGREKLGLAVDGLMATQEIVIKPLNKLVRENRYFAGSTIIGSGEVVLILDVANLILSKREALSEKEKNSKVKAPQEGGDRCERMTC